MDVERRYKQQVPGGDWGKVNTALTALYGHSKRTPSVLFVHARLQHTMTVGRAQYG